MAELFDITKIMFEKPAEWSSITNADKKKHFFICNRMFSIGHPLQANILQHIKMNTVIAMDIWQRFLTKTYKKVPFWMYTKGAVKVKKDKEKKINISNELIETYCRLNEIDSKTIKEMLKFYPEETVKELKHFEQTLK